MLRAVLVVGLGLSAGLLAACQHTTSPTAGCPPLTAPTGGVPGAADSAPGGGGLAVTGQGYSQVTYDTGGPQQWVSLGAEVRNSSSRVAYRVDVAFRYVDARNHGPDLTNRQDTRIEVPMILPGQRVPVGLTAAAPQELSGSIPLPSRVRSLTVTLSPVTWYPTGPSFQTIPTEVTSVTSTGLVNAAATSPYCRPLTPRGSSAVFRDTTGVILGGYFEPASRGESTVCRPGRQPVSLSPGSPYPHGTDTTRTQVASYCDLTPHPQTAGSAGPEN